MCFAPERGDFTHKLTQWSLGRLSLSLSLPPSAFQLVFHRALSVKHRCIHSLQLRSPLFGRLFRRRSTSLHYPSPQHPFGRACCIRLEPPRDRPVSILRGISLGAAHLFLSFHEPWCLLIYYTTSALCFIAWLHFAIINSCSIMISCYAFIVLIIHFLYKCTVSFPLLTKL